MTDKLERIAEELAARPYRIVLEKDTLSNGKEVFLARVAEIPTCMAQGENAIDAQQELAEVMVEFILSLLEDGEPVPAPQMTSTTTTNYAPADGLFRDTFTPDGGMMDDLSHAVQPETREELSKVAAWVI